MTLTALLQAPFSIANTLTVSHCEVRCLAGGVAGGFVSVGTSRHSPWKAYPDEEVTWGGPTCERFSVPLLQ
jgi:hypothetical protein